MILDISAMEADLLLNGLAARYDTKACRKAQETSWKNAVALFVKIKKAAEKEGIGNDEWDKYFAFANPSGGV